jgi:hypothetical protein
MYFFLNEAKENQGGVYGGSIITRERTVGPVILGITHPKL